MGWIFLAGAVLVTATNMAYILLAAQAQQPITRQAIEKTTTAQTSAIAEAIRQPAVQGNWAAVQSEFHRNNRFFSAQTLRLVTPSGTILADSSSDLPGGSLAFEGLHPALSGLPATQWQPNGHVLRVAVSLFDNDQRIVAVLISENSFQAEFHQLQSQQSGQALSYLLLNLVLVGFATGLYLRFFCQPLDQLYRLAKAAAQGSRRVRAPDLPLHEIQQISTAFNQIMDRSARRSDHLDELAAQHSQTAAPPQDSAVQNHTQRMAALIAQSERLNRPFAPQEAIKAIGEGALVMSQANSLAILTPTPEGKLTCAWSVGLPTHALALLTDSAIRAELEYSLSQRAPIMIADSALLVDKMVLAQLSSNEKLTSIGIWPLVYEGEVNGLVCCFYCDPTHWNQSEKEVLESFFRQAAAAMKNAHLFTAIRKQAEQINRLNEITQAALQTNQIIQILPEVARQVAQMLNADGCYITLWDTNRQVAIPIAAYGPNSDKYRALALEPGEITLTESALKAGRSLPVDNIYDTPYLSPHLAPSYPVRSLLTLPLIANEHKLGAVLVGFVESHHFSLEEITTGEHAAGQIALAFLKQHLLEVAQRRAQEAETLQQASIALTSSLELPAVLESILNHLEKVIQFDSACIFLIEPDYLRVGAVKNLDSPAKNEGSIYPRSDALFQEIAKTMQPVILPDAQTDRRFHNWGGTNRIHGWMGVPLISGQDLVGILTLDRHEINTFSGEEVKMTQAFANHAVIAVQNARLYQEAQQNTRELEALQTATTSLVSTLDLQKLLEQILEAVMSAIPTTEAATLHLLDLDSGQFQIRLSRGFIGSEAHIEQLLTEQDYWHDLLEKQRPLLIHQKEPCEDPSGTNRCAAALVAPLIQENETIGMLSLISSHASSFSESEMRLIVSFASTAATAIQNAQLHSAVQYLAITDPLTGMYNRRGFFEQAQQVMQTIDLYQRPLSIILLDIDYFKLVNDRFGHSAGDTVLQVLAERSRKVLRESDIICRYGGDEFAFLLPESDLAGASMVAERLLESIAGTPIQTNQSEISITISMGVATRCERCATVEELLKCADLALYRAKEGGRDQIRVWQADEPTTN
jgi:diguanylate cyclase (GGDEF)-like protein